MYKVLPLAAKSTIHRPSWLTSFVDLFGILTTFLVLILSISEFPQVQSEESESVEGKVAQAFRAEQDERLSNSGSVISSKSVKQNELEQRLFRARLEYLADTEPDRIQIRFKDSWLILDVTNGSELAPATLLRLANTLKAHAVDSHLFIADNDRLRSPWLVALTNRHSFFAIRKNASLEAGRFLIAAR